jgi:alkylation response protein AidB-like acyl-CoA dehydrogenase
MDLEFSDAEQAFRDEARSWLRANVPRDLPPLESHEGFAEHRLWDRKLFDAGWSVPTWPKRFGGRESSLIEWLIFEEEYHLAGGGLRTVHNGVSLLAPALFAFGTRDQQDRFLRRMACGEDIWCQGWSEPGAGSDLASLRSKAVRDDGRGGWLLTGQKTWSTRGAFSTHQFALFRTGAADSRHLGLTYFLVPLDSPGVTVRGFGRLGGELAFSEVFFDDVFVSDDNVLGDVGQGWGVAMSTTSNERGLTLRSPGWFLASSRRLLELWRSHGDPSDTAIGDEVARCWADAQAYRWNTFGVADELISGGDLGPRSSMAKIFWSELDIRIHETAMRIVGDRSIFFNESWVSGYLTSLSGPIWGGTNEVQRNVIAERVLGLPRK